MHKFGDVPMHEFLRSTSASSLEGVAFEHRQHGKADEKDIVREVTSINGDFIVVLENGSVYTFPSTTKVYVSNHDWTITLTPEGDKGQTIITLPAVKPRDHATNQQPECTHNHCRGGRCILNGIRDSKDKRASTF